MSKVLILGAAGQIPHKVIAALLQKTNWQMVLYDKDVSKIKELGSNPRITIIEGDFKDKAKLKEAMQGVDLVYLNSMESVAATKAVVDVMNQLKIKRFIGITIAGIENEVPAKLTKWAFNHLPAEYVKAEIGSTNIVKGSNLDYTLLKLTWLYNDTDDNEYELVPTHKEFRDAEVSREAVAKAVVKIMKSPTQNKYIRKSFGVGKPETHYGKPLFF